MVTATAAHPLGVQLFSLPRLLEQNFEGTLEMLAGIGYRELEFFGPYPFSGPEAQARWDGLAPVLGFRGSGYFGRTPQQVRELLDRHGLAAPAMHVDLETLRHRMGPLAEAAQVVGHRYVGIASIPDEERRTLDDYRRMADEFNEIGRNADRHGLRFYYHNHGYGLSEMEGQIPLRMLIERTDPRLVALEMDLYWTVAGGADPVELLSAYPGRYQLMHIKDMKERVRFSGDGGDAAQWMELFPHMTTAGSGVLDLPSILEHARASGVRHLFVEQDLAANPAEELQQSYRYLASLGLGG